MKDLTIFGHPLTVTFEPTEAEIRSQMADGGDPTSGLRPPTSEQIRVRHARIGDYDQLARLLEIQDEVGFTAAALGRGRKWVESLTPESYDQLAQVVQEVNQTGFFAYYGRRIGRRAATAAVTAQGESSLRSALAGSSPSPSASPT